MTSFVALLRAVNVGGTGKLPMSELVQICKAAGLSDVSTYIASGNALFRSPLAEQGLRGALTFQLQQHTGHPASIVIRSAAELARVVSENPFATHPGNHVAVLFTDDPLSSTTLEGATGITSEQLALGRREIFIYYPEGMARTRLRLPADRTGTARNSNTVTRLATLAANLAGSPAR